MPTPTFGMVICGMIAIFVVVVAIMVAWSFFFPGPPPKIVKVYYATWACVVCERHMSYGQRMDSNGVCPYCGAVSGDTIVDCVKGSASYEKEV